MISPEMLLEYGYQIALVVYLVYLSENHLKGIKKTLDEIKVILQDSPSRG